MRVYAITYDIYDSNGGAFKYATPRPTCENKIEFYSKAQRRAFINRYLYLTDSVMDLYIGNVKCYFSEMEEIKDMSQIINAI